MTAARGLRELRGKDGTANDDDLEDPPVARGRMRRNMLWGLSKGTPALIHCEKFQTRVFNFSSS